jgi:Tfp pilus assembly protein PilN
MPQDNINLLERKSPSGLASPLMRAALLAAGSALALGALLFVVESGELRRVKRELARTQAQAERLQHDIAEVPSAEAAMADRFGSQEREVLALEAVVRTLSTGGLAHTTGFVGPLQAFGRATTEGVWLTGLSLDNRHGSMVLEGRALDASRVPALLHTLGSEPYFAGTRFSAIDVTPGPADATLPADRALKFRISTPAGEAEAPAPGMTAATPARSPS